MRNNRGAGGGYLLTRSPERYTVGEILRILEGSLAPVACLEENAEPCLRRDHCASLPLWQELEDVVQEFLAGYSLEHLMQQSAAPEA